MSKAALVELVLRLQRPAKTSRTSSKPPSKVGHRYDLALLFDFATDTSRHGLILIKDKTVLR